MKEAYKLELMMKKRKQFRKRAALVISALLFMLSMTGTAFAKEQIDPERMGSLTVESRYEKKPVSDMEISIYDIAETDSFGNLTLETSFAGSGIEVKLDNDAAAWNEAAKSLAAYAEEQAVLADTVQKTDESGTACFEGLTPGLYLVSLTACRTSEGTYEADPFLVMVPGTAGTDDGWVYDVTAEPKIGFTEAPEAPVTEPETTPESGTAGGEAGGNGNGSGADGKLPWTGQLNWPIPVLDVLGMILVIVGILLVRRKKYE